MGQVFVSRKELSFDLDPFNDLCPLNCSLAGFNSILAKNNVSAPKCGFAIENARSLRGNKLT